MKSIQTGKFQRIKILVLLTACAVCLAVLWKYAQMIDLGNGDIIGYWSAAYQVQRGNNPYDPTGLGEVQRDPGGSDMDFVVMAWNPPTLFVFMLPLGWLSFAAARSAWLIVNVILLLAAGLLLARIYLPPGGKPLLGFLVLALLFPQVFITFSMGQVTFLVLMGLVAAMVLARKEYWFWAGAALVLTSAKPQIAFLAVPYLLMHMAYRRKWSGWLGLLAAGAACMAVLFAFRPEWIADFVGLTAMAPNNWATPTIGGLLSYAGITDAGRFLVIAFLPLAWWLARPQCTVRMETAVALLTVITVPTSFFGWGYDQSVLLIPMAELFGRLLRTPHRPVKAALLSALLGAFAILWIQRTMHVNELYYFWFPLFLAAVYGVGFAARESGNPAELPEKNT